MQFLTPLVDAWIGRARHVEQDALARVEGRTPAVVVTGGSSGIGLAIAQRFARLGRNVVLVARDPDRLASAVAQIGPAGACAISIDITAANVFERLQSELAKRSLYLDVLVNNAGIGLAGAFSDHNESDIEALVALDIAAPTRLMRSALPELLARGRGGIINIASLGGYSPGPGQAVYYASKAYLISLTEAVAWEIRGRGVRMCVVAPGPVDTGFHARMGSEGARYRRFLPAQSAEVVARAALRGYGLGQTVVVPGMLQKVLMLGQRVIPHPLLTPVIGWLLGLWIGKR